jgi:hypothetical protein
MEEENKAGMESRETVVTGGLVPTECAGRAVLLGPAGAGPPTAEIPGPTGPMGPGGEPSGWPPPERKFHPSLRSGLALVVAVGVLLYLRYRFG